MIRSRPMTCGTTPRSVIAVVGPTATGKTALGVHLARQLDSEVVSADSQVIYRHLDIGTAKPTEAERQGVPHHMIDVADPDEVFGVARYQAMATGAMERLWAGGRIPVVVGGTGFYLKALLEAEFIPDVPPDPAFRKQMTALAEEKGSPALHRMLAEKDPRRAADLHPNDRVRIIRALEIIRHTGAEVPRRSTARPLDVTWIGLTCEDRDRLRARIDARIDAMLEAGWLEEVRRLIAGYGPEAHALGVAHGYPEWVACLQGRMPFEEALTQVRINIHQYARRQMTWFRPRKNIRWLDADHLSPEEIRQAAGRWAAEKAANVSECKT